MTVAVESFPFRLDENTLSLVRGLIQTFVSHNARMQSASRAGEAAILFDKQMAGNSIDVNFAFDQDGLILSYPLQAIGKSGGIRDWMNTFHAQLQTQKKGALTPIKARCFVTVKAFYNGQLHYYLTYMVTHEDNTIAQDTPQGKLYATSSLFAPVASQPAASTQASGGHW